MSYTPELKSHIHHLISKVKLLILHHEYRVTVHWMDDPAPTDTENISTKMSIRVNIEYLYCTIWIYPEMQTHWDREMYQDIGDFVLHEMCHLLTEPLWDLIRMDMRPSQECIFHEIYERQNQRVTNARNQALPTDWYMPIPPAPPPTTP